MTPENFLNRQQWGARPPAYQGNTINAAPLGVAVHWEGPAMGEPSHDRCAGIVRGIQAYHIDVKGWADIAYNALVCRHGYVFEGRGVGKGSAANGTTAANASYYAVCALVGQGDEQTEQLYAALLAACDWFRSDGHAGDRVAGHRDFVGTACPGDELYGLVKAGRFGRHDVVTPKPPPPPPALAVPRYPLPRGWYFGPKSGPVNSVSGYYGHRSDLRRWQQRMLQRGWAGLGTADGLYGPKTARVAGQFQSEKHLHIDRLIGPETWSAAWALPVT